MPELDLTWYDAELPQGEMGRMYFREAEAVIDDFVQEPGNALSRAAPDKA